MTSLPDRTETARAAEDAASAFSGAAVPVAFDGMAGLFTPARRPSDTAVLLVSPWGLEELCVRKFWRVIAEQLGARDVASLRFDFPGTGDALDPASFEGGIAVWEQAIVTAAAFLRHVSGARRIVLVGQGLGASMAARIAARIDGLAGLALMAPVVSGRFYLRETAAMSRMVDDSLGLADDQRQTTGVSIGGLVMPDTIAADVKRLDLMALDRPPQVPCLVVERAARPSDDEFATYLAALGAPVERLPFDGYEALVSNPTISKVPVALAAAVCDWIAAPGIGAAVLAPVPLPKGQLEGGAFVETPVRFGVETPLYGVLCQPKGERRVARVAFLSTGYDRHSGWGRATTQMARQLAERGIASLRFDAANIADSPPALTAPEQVLYSPTQELDVAAALDFLAQALPGPVVLAGRCSGAYLAFHAAVADPRVAGAVVVNPYTFRWHEGRDVSIAMRSNPRALAEYGQRALRWSTVRRLLKGEIQVRHAAVNICRSILRKIMAPLMLQVRHFTADGRVIHAAFHELARRHMPLTLVYSDSDVGLEHFTAYFGASGDRIHQYANVQLAIIPDADHNLTPEPARRVYLDEVTGMALRFSEPR